MKNLLAIFLVLVLILGLLIVASPPQPVLAQSTFYVDDDAPNDPGPGNPAVSDPLEDGSAAHPFDKIQEGIDEASYGDTVSVAAGTYYENIILKDGVQLLGAGATDSTINGGGAGSVVTAISVGSDTVLAGFTITNGYYVAGGGIFIHGSSPVITDNTINNNSAGYGGGINVAAFSSGIISHNTIIGNSATFWGGGILVYHYSSPTIFGNTVADNSAVYFGGGMRIDFESSPLIINNIVTNNTITSGVGGGVSVTDGSFPIIVNSTITNNSASSGGGIYANVTPSPVIINSILWGNSDDLDGCTATYSDIEDGDGGAGNISLPPMFVDTANGDYHLQSGSPCINAGDNGAPSLPATDFEGDPRIWPPVGGVVDMGADEYVPPTTVVEATIEFDPDTLNLKSGGKVGIAENSIQAYIDGRSRLIITENTVQWHHLDWAAPGRHEFVNEPTVINGIEWFPVWPDVPDEENRWCNCYSSICEDLDPALPELDMEVELTIIQARHSISIVQHPSADNDYTLILEFNDNPLGGAAWYECELTVTWQTTARMHSKAPVTVYIELPDGYDVNEIDISSILLNGIVPARPKPATIGDYDSDGVSDLMVKFDRSDVQDVLEPGDDVEVAVSGELTDSTPFEGADMIRVK